MLSLARDVSASPLDPRSALAFTGRGPSESQPVNPVKTVSKMMLSALRKLHDAGIEGSDATTALDAFISRVSETLRAEVDGMGACERYGYLADRFGSDACRVAQVLTGGSR